MPKIKDVGRICLAKDSPDLLGNFTLTNHAKERIRQRLGIVADDAQLAWANEQIANSDNQYTHERQTTYTTQLFDIVCDGLRVITIKPKERPHTYFEELGRVLASEVQKRLVPKERLLRKAEIKVAELTLNMLKTRNPKTKELIGERLVNATDEKERIKDDIFSIKKAAKQYGVETGM